MSFSQVDISLDIKSNVNYPVNINILGNPYNLLDTSNAKTEYRWNVTSFVFAGETNVSIEYKINSSASFSTYTSILSSQNLQSVIISLNQLGIGTFNLYTELGQTYIGTYNDNYTFGALNIYNPSSAYLSYAWNMSGVGGKAQILVNLVSVVNDTSPVTASGNVPVVAGDTIDFAQTASTLATAFKVYNVTTSTYLYNSTLPPATGFNYSFTIVAGNSYLLTAQD